MKNLKVYFLVFFLGFFSCAFVCYVLFSNFSFTSFTIKSPETSVNWIDKKNITILDDKVVIKIVNTTLGSYTDTGSMKPVLDENSNGIEIHPENQEQINMGDIVVFRNENGLIAHRVIEKGVDENGIYFITQGDNNDFADGKIRFGDIESVVVGVIW